MEKLVYGLWRRPDQDVDGIRTTLLAEGMISEADLDLLIVTDSPAEVRDIVIRSMRDEPWREQQVRRQPAVTVEH